MILSTNVKINLGLNVLRKREDGFHDIETLFYPYFGMGDSLEIVQSDAFSIEIDGPTYTGWDPQKDLTAKAYRLLCEGRDLPPVHIRLHKTSPVGAGLGGGSADAVAALKMLDSLFNLSLSEAQMLEYAGKLGSDCPFFVHNTAKLASGKGEVLSDVEIDLSGYDIRVVVPEEISVSTAEAYGGIVPRIPVEPVSSIVARPVEQWRELLHNDFEDTVFPKHPRLAAMKNELYEQGAVYASMTGSGSALFGIFTK